MEGARHRSPKCLERLLPKRSHVRRMRGDSKMQHRSTLLQSLPRPLAGLNLIMPKVATSAEAAVQTCTAGASGTQCGLRWVLGANDGAFLGVGEQMAALEIVIANLADKAPGWASAVKGTGTSQGDVNAGSDSTTSTDGLVLKPTTGADRAGAAILTALMIVGVIGGCATMVMS